jgi:cytosine deaminase
MDLIVRNARLPDREEVVDLGVRDGVFAEIGAQLKAKGAREINAMGDLVSPPFIDPHIHLDGVMTAGKPRYNLSGTHLEGIEVWTEYKEAFLNHDEIKNRARRAVEWELGQGTLMIRTHVDVSDRRLTALRAILELREEVRGWMDLQIVAFPQEGILTSPHRLELVEEALRLGVDLVGGIPHCEWTREDGVKSIEVLFDLAQKYDRAIDMHCDETDDDHSRFLETLAAETIRRDYQGRVSASHTTAMHSYNDAYAFKLLGLLEQAKVNIIANPLDNIVLQGRFDVCHMSGYEEMHRMFDTVTVNSARTFGNIEFYGIREGNPAHMVILDAGNVHEALRLMPPRLWVIRNGMVVARTERLRTQVMVHGEPRDISYRLA